MIKTIPLDREWLARLRDNGYTADAVFEDGEQEALKHKLLSIGGEAVILRGVEPDLEKLMEFGQAFINPSIKLHLGRMGQCHTNSARLWKKSKVNQICTGYGLSEDGLWRQHSWCFDGKNVIETTEVRVAYFGIVLTSREAEVFCNENL